MNIYKFLFVFVLLAQIFWGGQGDMVRIITIADLLGSGGIVNQLEMCHLFMIIICSLFHHQSVTVTSSLRA